MRGFRARSNHARPGDSVVDRGGDEGGVPLSGQVQPPAVPRIADLESLTPEELQVLVKRLAELRKQAALLDAQRFYSPAIQPSLGRFPIRRLECEASGPVAGGVFYGGTTVIPVAPPR